MKTKVAAAEKMLFLINERVESIGQVSFNIIELMGSTNQIKVKQIAYLIAPFLLKSETAEERNNLMLLTTNIFMKDFKNLSGDCVIPSLALNCLSHLCDPELTSAIYKEIIPLFTCSNPQIRRKTCALCVKLFLHAGENEEIVEELVPFLSDRLKDSDEGVRMSAISAIHEISRVNPTLFTVTIPTLFQLLSEATNNWVLIKLIKLLEEFSAVEQRLLPKLKGKFLNLLDQQ
jgi:AP-3 complex subunit delta